MPDKILVHSRLTKAVLAPLASRFTLLDTGGKPAAEVFPDEVGEITALLTVGGKPLTGAEMDKFPKLGAIICFGTGYDGIDLAAAAARNIAVGHSPGANASSVADVAMTLMLAATLLVLAMTAQAVTQQPAPKTPLKHGGLASGEGYLRTRLRGALQLDVNLKNGELDCDGGPRPDGSGIRVSFAGPLRSDGRRLRVVFGVVGAKEGMSGKELATNLTMIFEGEERMFASRGDDKCTVDEFRQERVGALGGHTRTYRVAAKGFCIAPIRALNGEDTLLINSFDFVGKVVFEDPDGPS